MTVASFSEFEFGQSAEELTAKELVDFDKIKKHADSDRPLLWNSTDGEKFNLRIGPNYSRNKKKAPSGPALYDCIAADLIQSTGKNKIKHIASKVQLPKPRDVDHLTEIVSSGLPRLIILNIQIPHKAASFLGGKNYYEEDRGCSIVLVYSIKPETVALANELLKEGADEPQAEQTKLGDMKETRRASSRLLSSIPNLKQISRSFRMGSKHEGAEGETRDTLAGMKAQIQLLRRYTQEASTNPDIRRRFKGMLRVENWQDFSGIKPVLKQYNGKPAIINKLGDLYQDATKAEYLEIDIKIHEAKYVSKKGLDLFRGRTTEAFLCVGFTIQGEADEELPENICGCTSLRNINIDASLVPQIN